MTNLLKTEWLKIKRYPAFWWMVGIIALTYPGINYLIYKVLYVNQLNDERMGLILRQLRNPFTFPDIWHSAAYISSWFIFIPSIIVIMFITNEYTYKTHRQNIIDGWSRREFMLAKMIDLLIICVLITVIYMIVALVIGYVNFDQGSGEVWAGTKYIGLFFLQTFSQLSIAFLIAFLLKRAFVALGVFLFYYVILEPVLVALGREWANDMGRFMPLEISDRMLPIPRFFVANEDEWSRLNVQSTTHVYYTVLLLILTWGLCFWMNSKRDL